MIKHPKYHTRLANTAYDTLIIGSGIGGLTTAILLAKAGQKVLVLERHYVPGGYSHTFKRKQFEWDVGVHYVGQVNQPDSMMARVFNYVTEGQLEWADMGEIYDKAIIGDNHYTWYKGRERTKAYLLKQFPEEQQAIERYFELLKQVGAYGGMFFGERTMPPWLSKTAGYFLRKNFYPWSDQTTYEVLRSLTDNEELIALLATRCGNYGLPPKRSSFMVHVAIEDHFQDGGAYPVGGAANIHGTLISVLEKYGGKVVIKTEVEKVLLNGKKAVGVQLTNGDQLRAKRVVSNAGAYNSLMRFLPEGVLPQKMYESLAKIRPSIAHGCLYIGLNASDQDLKLPKCNYWVYSGNNFDQGFEKYEEDPDAPLPLLYVSFPSAKDPSWPERKPGMATLQVISPFPYHWVQQWQNTNWQKRPEAYNQLKTTIKSKMLSGLLKHFPQLEPHLEYVEFSTPLSTRHFTNYQHGEIYGLEHTPARFRQNWLRPYTPIKNYYLTGQDIITVGVGGALFSGYFTAFAILKWKLIWQLFKNRDKFLAKTQRPRGSF